MKKRYLVLIFSIIFVVSCIKREIYIQRKTLPYKIKSYAEDLLRKPYCYGGSGPECFDCSGLAFYVYRRAGIKIPRASRDIAKAGKKITKLNQVKIGDILVFKLSSGYHVGIYVGNMFFVHSPKKGEFVRKEKLTPFWIKRFLFARRFI